jgi:hypothetical protein
MAGWRWLRPWLNRPKSPGLPLDKFLRKSGNALSGSKFLI